MVSCVKLAGIDQTGARTFLARAQQIAKQMQQRGQLAPRDLWMLDDLAKRIAALPQQGGVHARRSLKTCKLQGVFAFVKILDKCT
jgi:hypothetical protein